MAIVANRFPRVRAVVAGTIESARYAREHNDANVLVLGADYLSTEKAKRILRAWLSTPFGGGRHARRLRQVERIEKRLLGKKKQFVDRSS